MLVIITGGVFGLELIQDKIINVSAQIDPVAFIGPDTGFGVVFPAEILEKDFYVSASPEYENPISYSLILQPKPRLGFIENVGKNAASEYCIQTPDDIENCYPLLCPYLGIISKENEGDTKVYATLKENREDNDDYWKVALNVPPLKGYVGQNFNGIPAENAGEYGCDINLVLLETVAPEFVPGSTVFTASTGIYYPLIGPKIFEEKIDEVGEDYAVITWLTDFPATSRVIYDAVSHPILGFPPNYSYAFSTLEQDLSPKTQFHRVKINGLNPGTAYFYRTVSRGSPEMTSREHGFTTKEVIKSVQNEIAQASEEGKEYSSQASISQASIKTSTPSLSNEAKEVKKSPKTAIQQAEKTTEEGLAEEAKQVETGTGQTKNKTTESVSSEKFQANVKNWLTAIRAGFFSIVSPSLHDLGELILILVGLIVLSSIVLRLITKRKK